MNISEFIGAEFDLKSYLFDKLSEEIGINITEIE